MDVVIPVFNTPHSHTNEVEYLCLSLYECSVHVLKLFQLYIGTLHKSATDSF